MSVELISVIALVLVFLIATVLPVHMGVLAFVAAFVVGTAVAGKSADDVIGGFPGSLFVILVGVTLLFAIAKANGTVDWLVQLAVRAVRGRIVLIPWVMFAVTAVLTALGAVVPGAVAVIAPVGMGFAKRYGINPVLMGMLIAIGATAGGFSPISIYGSITNGILVRNGIDPAPTYLFLASLAFNIVLAGIVFLLFGGRALAHQRDKALELSAEPVSLSFERVLTLVGLLGLAVGALVFSLDVGFTALTVAAVLSVVSPGSAKGAVAAVAWPTVLLICGIVTYVSLMQNIGTIKWLSGQVSHIGAPLVAAMAVLFIGAIVSAFASTTGILGALIPLAVPLLATGGAGGISLIVALCISSSVVDTSPFSTSGALVVANAPEDDRDQVFKRLLVWGLSMAAIAPVVTWLIFVLPAA